MSKLCVTSLDEILKWMDVEYRPDLPNPGNLETPYVWQEAVLPDVLGVFSLSWNAVPASELPSLQHATYRKDRLCIERDDKIYTLPVWRKE